MSWIKTISFEAATGKLKKLYQRVVGPDDNVDNILMAHSLRPHTLEGHMALYKNVLHHNANQLEKHWLEALGVYVSLLNRCDYCVEHHYQGYKRLINDDERAQTVREALQSDRFDVAFSAKESTLFQYAKKLTLTPYAVAEADLAIIRDAGYDDGEILEVNQVVAYFNYANRTVLGLGVSTEGDLLGLSPNDSDDPDNWQHN
ncbi:carboxymuconolactone decarboxylase family protein [Aliikangiella coralliicola]|uniref:Peroxidase-related enzyme n=1 Tax=Aliikangiella coralliicola TaxID=2592383 RepID=A0A545U7C2_9GAMM|nr:peroxidase-related enzyme [Aliikangiella coralliicola]TQV85366.1 peroxidase-related enzyme [Aliikangiella coralliicola]